MLQLHQILISDIKNMGLLISRAIDEGIQRILTSEWRHFSHNVVSIPEFLFFF